MLLKSLRCISSIILVFYVNATFAQEESYNADPETVNQWMLEWMSAGKAPSGGLHLLRFKDPMYVLLKPIGWKPDDPATEFQEVTVPKGFVTDLTSVPRLFWSLFRPDGEYTYPAIIHDYLYWDQSRDREEADKIFLLMMQEFDVDAARVIYKAVDLGAQGAWDKNKALKESGERRLLSKFPQDPRMTWEKWKHKDRVFAED